MSRAFVKDANYLEEMPARPVTGHPNGVTEAGLAQIEHALATASEAYAAAQASADRAALAAAGRDLLLAARRATARLVPTPTDHSEVRFSTSVTIVRDGGREQTFRIWRRQSQCASATWSEPAAGKPRSSGSSNQSFRALELGRGM